MALFPLALTHSGCAKLQLILSVSFLSAEDYFQELRTYGYTDNQVK